MVSANDMPQRSPMARKPASESSTSASTAAAVSPASSRICARLRWPCARTHGSGSSSRGPTMSTGDSGSPPSNSASGPIARSSGCAWTCQPGSSRAAATNPYASSSRPRPADANRPATAYAVARATGSVGPGTARAAATSSAPSALCPPSHQYQPAAAASRTAVAASPTAIAPRRAAVTSSCSAATRRSHVSCSARRRWGSASSARATTCPACARRVASRSPASSSRSSP